MNKFGFFSKNKQKIREINLILIEEEFKIKNKKLKYLGLPSEGMKDVFTWKKFLSHVSAIERGVSGQEHIRQHNILLKSLTLGISNMVELFRGEMDDILINSMDGNGKRLLYPYDLINLDYTGGVIYKESPDISKRVSSIKMLFSKQAECKEDFLLFITCNLDNNMEEEYKFFIEKFIIKIEDKSEIETLKKKLINVSKGLKLTILILSLIQDIAKEYFECSIYKPIFYTGNKTTSLVNFSFRLKYIKSNIMEKKTKYSVEGIINFKCLICHDGKIKEFDRDKFKLR